MNSDSPATDGVAGTPVTLDSNGVALSADQVVGPGGLAFSTHYSGDSTYAPSDGACEPLTANPLTGTVITTIRDGGGAAVTSALVGATVHDTATVTGDPAGPVPGGTVAFTVYAGTTCSGTGSDAGTASVIGGIADGSIPQTVAAGGLSFSTHYSGDGTYGSADGACEPLTAGETPSSPPTLPPNLPTSPPRPPVTPAPPPYIPSGENPSTPSNPPSVAPSVEPTSAPTASPAGSVLAATSKPHITPPPTTTSGTGNSGGGMGLAATLVLLVSAAGVILLATPKRRSTRR